MAADINDEIYNRIDTFMRVPYHMNEVNYKVIENGMLNLSDEKQRDRFLLAHLSHTAIIYTVLVTALQMVNTTALEEMKPV